MPEAPKTPAKPAPKPDDVQVQQRELPSGPTVGELEERAIDLENENAELKASVQRLEAMMERLMAAQGVAGAAISGKAASPRGTLPDGTPAPVFDPEEPHGIVVGDSDVAYVQNGHEFGRDRQYLRTDPNRGVPRAFNPRLVGVVKRPPIAA